MKGDVRGHRGARAIAAVAYAAAVLGVDTLAARSVQWPVDWGHFRWTGYCGADLFKLAAWLAVPLLLSLGDVDWGYFGTRRWGRYDGAVLGMAVVVGLLAVVSIRFVPSLQAVYHGMAAAPAAAKWRFLVRSLVWTLSWLAGWEFLHRYFLLVPLERWAPRYGWLLVPVSEGLYHLQKPLLEAAGMVGFSLVFTYYARKRKNALLPFLAHLAIEIELALFLLFV